MLVRMVWRRDTWMGANWLAAPYYRASGYPLCIDHERVKDETSGTAIFRGCDRRDDELIRLPGNDALSLASHTTVTLN